MKNKKTKQKKIIDYNFEISYKNEKRKNEKKNILSNYTNFNYRRFPCSKVLFKEEKITKILEEKLSKTFKYFNSDSFVLVDVPGDGNCGYYTIQLFL